jgi:hypothetical protein
MMSSPTIRRSIFRVSLTTALISSTTGSVTCLRENASSWRVSEVARTTAASISSTRSRSAWSFAIVSASRPLHDEITASRLLKSWATPPASSPSDSIFCAWRS